MPKRPIQYPGPAEPVRFNLPHGNRRYTINEMEIGEERFFPWEHKDATKTAFKNWRAAGRCRDLYGMRFAKTEFFDGIRIRRLE